MREHIQRISYITAALVVVLAIIAFILSYNALQHLAAVYAWPGWLSYLWPLLLDFAMIVFSLAILRANLRQEPAWYPWVLTVFFAGLAVLANVLEVVDLGLPPYAIAAGVKALAPIALVLAFELLMQMIRAEIRRADVEESLAALQQQAAADSNKVADLTANIEQLTAKRNGLQDDLKALRSEKRETKQLNKLTGDDTRAAAMEILAQRPDITGSELGRQLERSASLGRKLKKELLPQLNGNGNHS